MHTSLSIITLNVRGLNNILKCIKLSEWFKDLKYDIILLQETYFTQDKNEITKNLWEKEHAHHVFSDSSHSRGVSILFNPLLNAEVLNIHKSMDARKLLINVNIGGTVFCIVNVYAPNKVNHRKDFFNSLNKWLTLHCLNDEMIIIGGDFNCALNTDDREPPAEHNDTSCERLKGLLKRHNLMDSSEVLGKKAPFTWQNNHTKSRLDYMFISKRCEPILGKLRCSFFISSNNQNRMSDHKYVNIILKEIINPRGPGYWKLNTSVLEDIQYKNQIKEMIQKAREREDIKSKALLWEAIKIEVSEQTKLYSKAKVNNIKSRERNLREEINRLEGSMETNRERLEQLNDELNKIYDIKARGQQIRSKADWVEKGERSNKYFFRLEKSRQCSNVIRRLTIGNREVTDSKGIQREIARFYSNLYQSTNIQMEEVEQYMQDVEVPIMKKGKREECDTSITKEELRSVVNKLKPNKSPGSDGLPGEFYKAFWEELEDIFIDMMVECFESGELPPSMKRAVTALIFKKGEKSNLENYRPISLTNVDYKIIAGVLAKRIQTVLPDLVTTDQTGYIKGRYIGTNARVIQDIFELAERENIEGALLMLDFRKAFDSLEHNFIKAALKKFGFGEYLIKWVEIIYKGACFNVKNNGWLGRRIFMKRGIRQGCPVSGQLFVLAVEIMACKIRQNNSIRGFRLEGMPRELKISQYVDDSTICLRDHESIPYVIETIKDFGRVAGPLLNLDKTEGIWLGSLKNFKGSYAGINFTEKAVRCLGFYIGHSKQEMDEKNWTQKIKKISTSLQVWKTRNLTLIGKILILKTFALSQITYIASIQPCPENISAELEKLFYDFIWKGRDRIRRKILINKLEEGGLKMINVRLYIAALQASWVPRIIKADKEEAWVSVLNYTVKNQLGCTVNDLLLTNITDSKSCQVFNNLPTFIREVIFNYNRCKDLNSMCKNNNATDIASRFVWGNTQIKFKNKCLWYKHWLEAGFKYIKDFFDNTGEFITPKSILQKLSKKNNWMCEYITLKKSITNFCKPIDTRQCINVEIKSELELWYDNKLHMVKEIKSNVIYWIMVKKISERNYMEEVFTKQFDCKEITRESWARIYVNQCHTIRDKKIGMFNYKILTNSLPSPVQINKWNANINKDCETCEKTDTIAHILYECKVISPIWKKVGNIIKTTVNYRDIVLGASSYDSKKREDKDTIISHIAYYLYSFKMLCKNKKDSFNHNNVCRYISAKIHTFCKVYEIIDPEVCKVMMNVLQHL